MVTTLTLGGLRIGELLALRWDDVDLAAGRVRIGDAKTAAGRRHVTIRPALRQVLVDLKAQTRPKGSELLFAGMSATNFRRRVLAKAAERANERLAADELPALPEGLTPHSLRRTFASLLYALGEPPPVVMAEMGSHEPVARAADLRAGDEARRVRGRAAAGARGRGVTPAAQGI